MEEGGRCEKIGGLRLGSAAESDIDIAEGVWGRGKR